MDELSLDRAKLVDLGGYPEIYADGIGAIEEIGGNVRMISFTWRRIDGVFRKCIVVSIVRPARSIAEAVPLFQTAMTISGKTQSLLQ